MVLSDMNDFKLSIGIVGVGVKGTYAFHRLSVNSLRPEFAEKEIEIFLIDPCDLGAGETYPISSEDYLIMNTVSSQITAYSDSSSVIEGELHDGPNLYEWLNANGRAIDSNEYPKRREHGAYLNSVVRESLKIMRSDIRVTIIRAYATDLACGIDGYTLKCNDGTAVNLDVVLLSFGGQGVSEPRVFLEGQLLSNDEIKNKGLAFHHCYPLEQWKNSISPQDSVGIIGMGLGMIDAVMSLSVARGGKFEKGENCGELLYIPSGQEPKIVCWCRAGLPALARAKNQKSDVEIHEARFATLPAIDALRQGNLDQLLDFERDLFPLLLKDMEVAFRSAKDRKVGKYLGEFDWKQWETPDFIQHPTSLTSDEFNKSLIEFIEEDIFEAKKGNIDSPFKAACDVLRDIRDNIRYAVEYGGLSPESHGYFTREFSPTHNRLVVGPPLFRSEQMLALQKSGTIEMGLGPKPRLGKNANKWTIETTHFSDNHTTELDILIDGRVIRKKSEFLENILLRGMVSLAKIGMHEHSFQTSALRCDKLGRIVNSQGEIQRGIFVVGQPVEGYHWYTFVAARPGVNSRAISDADSWSLMALRYTYAD